MSLLQAILVIIGLIIISAVVSSAEISLAGSRKLKLQMLANEGDKRAVQVLKLQEQPGRFITVVQIGLNMVAIFGGIVGESAIRPFLQEILSAYTQSFWVESAASWLAFIIVTVSFVLFADLMPKRLAMTSPEKVALSTVGIMSFCIVIFKPVVLILILLRTEFFAYWEFLPCGKRV